MHRHLQNQTQKCIFLPKGLNSFEVSSIKSKQMMQALNVRKSSLDTGHGINIKTVQQEATNSNSICHPEILRSSNLFW